MDDGITCLGIQLLNAQPGIIIFILKILLGKCHEIKIHSVSGRNQCLHISCVRINPVHGRRQHSPRHQHGGKFTVNRSLHPLHYFHTVPDLPLSVPCFISVIDHPIHYPGIFTLGCISGIILLHGIITAIHIFRFIRLLGCKAVARAYVLIQAVFEYFKSAILSIGLYNMCLFVKTNLIFSNQVFRCILTVIAEIGAACQVIDICFPCIGIPADFRHKRKRDFPGIVPVKMSVCQFPVHVCRNLVRYNIGAVRKHDGLVVIVILPIPGITLQCGHITVRPSVCIAVPGNGQSFIQSGKNGQIVSCLFLRPKERLFIGGITVKFRFCFQNLSFIAVHVKVINGKLPYCLLGFFPLLHLYSGIHGVKKFCVIIGSVFFCLQQPPSSSPSGRKIYFLYIAFEILCPYIF